MNILLYHCSFHNQGDVLMLLSAKKILEQTFPTSHFYALSSDNPDNKLLQENEISLLDLNIDYLLPQKPFFYRVISKIYKIINKKDLETFEKINLVVDVNGYFMGDKWGVHVNLYRAYHLFKKMNMQIILMPKSFGMFKNPLVSGNASAILSCADLIFARDSVSLEEVKKIAPYLKNIHLNSDYTSICKPKITPLINSFSGKIAIIINNRMVWKSEKGIEEYKKFLSNCIEIINDSNLEYYFLLHDYKRDIHFISELEVPNNKIIKCKDALELKGYASVAKLVISSRYHGILNALNSCTPVIGTSWAHKYNKIAEEYGVKDYIVKLDVDKKYLRELINSALNHRQYHIVNAEQVQKDRKMYLNEITKEISEITKLRSN